MQISAIVLLLLFLSGIAAARDDLILGMVLEPPHLDPTAGAAEAIDEVVYANIFEGLTRIAEDGGVKPALARDWQISEDGLLYTFRLQPDVAFHDGTVFDASDVKFSLDRIRAADSVNAQKALFEAIETVEIVDPLTVRLRLSRPHGDLLFVLGLGDAVMVAPESAAGNRVSPVGTGPFRFQRWRRGDRIRLQRWDDYWGPQPALSAVRFQFISEPSAAFASVKAGIVDGFANFPAPETIALLEQDPELTVARGATEGEMILALNHRHPALSDIRVRRALSHAIDKQAVIEGALFGHGIAIGTHFPPYHPAALDLADRYAHDPKRSRALLLDATGAETLSLRLALPPPSYARRSGELIAAQLRDVGVEVRIEALEWAQWLDRVFIQHDFDMTIIAHTEPRDIGIYARPDYYFGYDNARFRELIARLDATADGPERDALLQEAQRILSDDAVNVFLAQLPKLSVWDRRLSGLWRHAPVQANDLRSVRWQADTTPGG